jgi:hypothetical protein
VLTPEEKAKVRRHGGYPNISAASTFIIGNPAAMEPFFILEAAMDAIIPSAEFLIREFLPKLDHLAEILFEDADTLIAKSIGDIVINPDQFEKLLQRYRWYAGEMLQVIACWPNPFDVRFASAGGGINVSVG